MHCVTVYVPARIHLSSPQQDLYYLLYLHLNEQSKFPKSRIAHKQKLRFDSYLRNNPIRLVNWPETVVYFYSAVTVTAENPQMQ